MTMTVNESTVGTCVTAINTEATYNLVDYAQMKDALKHAVELYYGVKDGPVGDVWYDQQYDTIKAHVEKLEAENPTWKELYESGQVEYNVGQVQNG